MEPETIGVTPNHLFSPSTQKSFDKRFNVCLHYLVYTKTQYAIIGLLLSVE